MPLPEGQAFSLWAFWRDTLYSSLKERVGRWAPFPPLLCGLPDWCVWSDAFPEKFQPQRSRLAAAKDVWEKALNPSKPLGPWWISWVSSSHPLFFLTLVSVCKQSTHRILWLSHHCWFLMGQWLLRMSCKVLGVVESRAKRGHFELGRAKTSVRALSVVREWNPLDLTSLLGFVDYQKTVGPFRRGSRVASQACCSQLDQSTVNSHPENVRVSEHSSLALVSRPSQQ